MASNPKQEFSLWLSQRQEMLISAARGICFDTQIAEDVLQEALVDVFKRWNKIKNHENLEAYTMRVMISKHADMRRKWNRRKYENEVEISEAFQLLDGSESTDSILQSIFVQEALKSLGPMQRAVLLLHYQYGYTLRDISQVLHIPPGTAASHLARGKAAVAERTQYLPEIAQNERKALEQLKEIDDKEDTVKRGKRNE